MGCFSPIHRVAGLIGLSQVFDSAWVQFVNQQLMYIEKSSAPSGDRNSSDAVAVLEQLLVQSIRLRDLLMNTRWQISSGEFGEIRKMLNDHYKEQLSLIGTLVDRLRILGGAARVFAADFLQRSESCRVIRGPKALTQLLYDLLEAHEAVLAAARPHDSHDDLYSVRDFAVGQVVLTNEQQWEIVNHRVMTSRPQQRILETGACRLNGYE
jgi:starvation-inducible DNA-binding protein